MSHKHRTWIEVLVPIIVILGLFTLTLIWNIVAAFVVLFVVFRRYGRR